MMAKDERDSKDEKEEDCQMPDCKKCSKKVGEEDNALQCDMCEWWLHIDCEGMAKSV